MCFYRHILLFNTLYSFSLRLDANSLSIAKIFLGNPANLIGHGGREQRALTFRWSLGQNGFNIINKAHTQHFVCFIQNQPFDLAEIQAATTQMVEHTTRGTHHNLHTALKAAQLATNIGATINGQHIEAFHIFGIALESLSHLNS